MDKLKQIIDEFKTSNNKVYFLLTHKKLFLWTLAGVAFVLGVFGYIESKEVNGFDVINRSFGLFAFAWIDDTNNFLVVARFLAVLTLFLGAIALFLSDLFNAFVLKSVVKKPYDLIIGLGEQNSNFLKSQKDKSSSTIIIESDKNNPHIEKFKELGYGVLEETAQSAIEHLDLSHLKSAIISTGDDRQNINIAILLMDRLKKGGFQKIFVRIENRDMGVLFKQSVIKKEGNVDVIVYSLYENMTKELFEKHSILGLQRDIVESDKSFNIVLIGDSPLAEEIVFQLCILSNLPNQNILNLHLLGVESKKFHSKIRKLFSKIDNIPHVNIEAIECTSESLEFYTDKVWRKKNLTNIIIATESEKRNLDIAINLQDTTFVKLIAEKKFNTKVLFANYVNLGLADKIDSNKEAFANFYSFANIAEASKEENLIDPEMELAAKAIHYLYTKPYFDTKLLFTHNHRKDIEKTWADIKMFSDKISNKMQSIHINTKLLALGLRKQKSSKSSKKLLEINREIFEQKLGDREVSNKELEKLSKILAEYRSSPEFDEKKLPKNFKPSYFTQNYESLFSKLVRAEHNRWSTYHYLDGWSYNKVKNKAAKDHDCLKPIEEFESDRIKALVLFDIYSVLYLPNIMASVGVELVEEI